MASNTTNGFEAPTQFVPESPFLETPALPAAETETTVLEDRFLELDSPFLRDTYAQEAPSPLEAEFAQLLGELHDESFTELVREMAAEAVAQHLPELNTEFSDREAAAANAEHVLSQHFAPLADHAEMMLERFAQSLGRYDVQALTAEEVDRVAEQFHPMTGQLSPTFEEFLGKLFKKATGFVKGAVNMAKKGLAAVGKLGLGPILAKLKKFVWPLLKRVVQMALNRLPAGVRPLAQKLAAKLLGTREAEVLEAEAGAGLPATATGEHIQLEFDVQVVQTLFAGDEAEMEQFAAESIGQSQMQLFDPVGELQRARERLVGELGRLQQGQDATPVIQNFLPAALLALQPIAKIAVTIIGRPKVVDFVAKLLAKLIERYVGAEGAQALSRAVADVGLSLIGLEVTDHNRERLGYETLGATLEQTVTNLLAQPEYMFESPALLEAAVLQSFEGAVKSSFPPQLLKYQMRPVGDDPSKQGVFVPMPSNSRRKYYRKYSKALPLEIPWAMAEKIKTYGMFTLADFFRDQLLLPANQTVRAKAHVYEAVVGSWLGYISQMETSVPGLGSYSRQAYFQFHPLTVEAATELLREPGLGKDVDPVYLAGREALTVGQRVYYLEIPGLSRGGGGGTLSSYIRIEVDLKRVEIRVYIYLSEKASQEIAQQLKTSGAVAGALQTIAAMVGAFINTVKSGKAGKAVKVIRETLEPEQLALPSVGAVLQGARSAASAIGGAVTGAMSGVAGAATAAASGLAGRAGAALGGVGAGIGGGGGAAAAGGAGGGVGGAIAGAALDWLVNKVLDWANQALGTWLVSNKELFIRHANDPSKKGVTIILTYSPTQDILKRILLTTFYGPLMPNRIELVAGPR